MNFYDTTFDLNDNRKLENPLNSKRYAVCTVAHREAEYIGACIKNWEGVVDKHLVLVSAKAWNGGSDRDDGTLRIANATKAEVILGEWKTEAEQRDWGLARLYDYDYVLIVDADELYTKEDQAKILWELDHPIRTEYTPRADEYRNAPAFKVANMVTYWKTHEYIYDPPDKHKPVIAVDPKQIHCHEHRQFKYPYSEHALLDYAPKIDVTCHHFSMAKSDEKIKEKLQSFSHADSIKPNWYDDVWMHWTPGTGQQIRPYGIEPSIAIYKPAPDEIVALIDK